MKKTLWIVLALIVVVIIIIVIAVSKSGSSTGVQMTPVTEIPDAATTTPATSTTTMQSYAMSDVAMHATQASCWSAINGKVYDLTTWIGQHPGGEGAILGICGKDGSAAFNGQHGGQQKQADILATFYIGDLKK